MKVALVSAAWPPARCGVGDYTARLADALELAGARVVRFGHVPRKWGTRAAAQAAGDLARADVDIVHIQYPTAGYRRSLLPALLPVLTRHARVAVTLHEFSIFRPYRWPWFASFAYATRACVFTSKAEAATFARCMPGMIARSIVIPIGSNIPAGRPAVRDNHSICYFGLLMPGKGVEEFLALAERLRAGAPGAWRAVLIGAAAEGAQAYAENVLSQAKALGVALHVGLGAADVADVLQTMQYAYLPGPGGITERRGAVLAALENGVRILGPVSGRTPEWLAARVIAANNPDAAYDALMRGRFSALAATEVLAATAWSAIAARHVELYEDMLRRKQP